MKKKLLAILLVVCVVAAMVPISGLASDDVINTEEKLITAIGATTAGDTVTLSGNIELTKTLVIPADKDLILDLNGKTISQSKAQTEPYSMIENRGTLTIKDSASGGKISYADTTEYATVVNYVSNTITNRGTLNVLGGIIENNSARNVGYYGYPYTIDNYSDSANAELNITGGVLNNTAYCAVRLFCNSTANTNTVNISGTADLNSGIEFQNPNAAANKGVLNISGGSITANEYVAALYASGANGDNSNMDISITGGTFTGNITITPSIQQNFNEAFISGGTFSADVSDYTVYGYKFENGSVVEDATVGEAKVGGVKYATLAEAIAAAVPGDTVMVLKDVELPETITIPVDADVILDLNGNEIVYNVYHSAEEQDEAILNNGKLLIKDSVGTGKITSFYDHPANQDNSLPYPYPRYGSNTITNRGHLTIEGGTIECTTEGDAAFAIDTGNKDRAAKLVIEGGKITHTVTTKSGAIRICSTHDTNENQFVMTDGEVSGRRGITLQLAGGHLNKARPINVEISGGTITSTDTNSEKYRAVYSWSDGIGYDNVSITINGTAVLNGNVHVGDDYRDGMTGAENVDILGGTINGEVKALTTPSHNITVSGGTFSTEPDAAYLAEGYDVIEDGSGYTVAVLSLETAVAAIGETPYAKLAEAIAAAKDGETVTLLKNVKVHRSVGIENKSITLDLGGYTISPAANFALEIPENDFLVYALNETDAASEATATIKNGTIDAEGKVRWAFYADGYNEAHNSKLVLNTEDLIIKNTREDGRGTAVLLGYDVTMNAMAGTQIITVGTYSSVETSTGPVMNIFDGAKVSHTSAEGGVPGGNLGPALSTAYDSTINVFGGEFTSDKYSVYALPSGGAINISGGTFVGDVMAHADAGKTSNVVISGGSFAGMLTENGGEITITGGHFTTDPSAYLASGLVAVASDKQGYSYTVAEKNANVKVETDVATGTSAGAVDEKVDAAVKTELETTFSESNMTQTSTSAAAGLSAAASAVTNDANVVGDAAIVKAVKEIPNSNVAENATVAEAVTAVLPETVKNTVNAETNPVTVVVQPYMDVTVKEVAVESAAITSITVDIEPKYNLVATTKTVADGGTIKTEESTEGANDQNAVVLAEGQPMVVKVPVTISIPLPSTFEIPAKLYVIHEKDNGDKFVYEATVTNIGGTNYATFENPNGFSVFSLATVLDMAAKIGDYYYETLAEAVAAVQNGQTIVLLDDCAETITVTRTVSFTLDDDVYGFAGEIAAGAYTTKTVDGDVYSFTFYVPYYPEPEKKECDGGEDCLSAAFTDVDNTQWYHKALDYAISAGIMKGMSATEFAPDGIATRAMVWAMLARLNGVSTAGGNPWYAIGQAWAMENGVSDGTAPTTAITREQLVSMLWRYAKYTGMDVSVGEETNILSYEDAFDISEWAIPAMQWACGEGLVSGDGNARLNPRGLATRAEVAQIFMNYFGK